MVENRINQCFPKICLKCFAFALTIGSLNVYLHKSSSMPGIAALIFLFRVIRET